ncbi:MAG: hypothetical protein K5651_05205 [Bacteroidales bacterium]|nr:hypothetical protein [Bacteroidales bacterium]
MKIEKISKNTAAAHLDDGRVFILSNRIDGSLNSFGSLVWQNNGRNWEILPQTVGDAQVVPYGPRNELPTFLRDVIGENNLVPGILNRQLGLLWGQGPQLYQLGYVDGKITQFWLEDAEIQSWLGDWDYKKYLRGCSIDFLTLGGFFDSKYLERGHRIGRAKRLALLKHIPAKNARLEWVDSHQIDDVQHIFEGDFENQCLNTGIKSYPVYDRRDPGRYPVSAAYNHLYSFSRDFYAVPQYWGALRWIIRGSEIPLIFKYVTDNGINLAYHVHSTESYWNYRREALRNMHPDWTDAEVEDEIMNITTKLLDSMVNVLTGKENAGKLFHSIDTTDEQGNVQSWKVEAIDQKIKDFVESQLKIGDASVSAITSGMGLHPSLSNIMVNGKLASGSELLYAFKLYLHTDLEIPTSIILEPINQAIAYNFPGKNVKLGFYHQSIQSEEALSSGQRLKNS